MAIDGILIERSTNSGQTYSQIASVTRTVTGYTDSGLNLNTNYQYRICSYKNNIHGKYTPIQIITSDDLFEKYWETRYPSDLDFVIDSYTGLTLNWVNNGIQNYDYIIIEKSLNSGATYSEIYTGTTGETTYTDITYSGSTTSLYRLKYQKNNKYSQYSNIINSDRDYFITTYNTSQGYETTNVVIPTSGSGYDFYVNWCDGTPEEHYTGSPGRISHDYGVEDQQRVKIRGTFPRINYYDEYMNDTGECWKLCAIQNWGDMLWDTMEYAFINTSIGIQYGISTDFRQNEWEFQPNLSQCISLESMFTECYDFSYPYNIIWEAPICLTAAEMFRGSPISAEIINFNLPLSTNISSMFADCMSMDNTTVYLNGPSVINAENLFNFSTYNKPLDTIYIPNVQRIGGLVYLDQSYDYPINFAFNSLNSISTPIFGPFGIFNNDISLRTTSSINLQNMFRELNGGENGCRAKNIYLDIPNVTSIYDLFSGPVIDGSIYITGHSITNLSRAFRNNYNFNGEIYIDAPNATTMSYMFDGCYKLIKPLNGINVTSMTGFTGAFRYVDIDVDGETINYDTTLISWASQATKTGATIDAPFFQYSDAAINARNHLVNDLHWVINDGGVYVIPTGTPVNLPLEITYDWPISESMFWMLVPRPMDEDVSQWNCYFKLPNNGGMFSNVNISGKIINLYGTPNIKLSRPSSFDYDMGRGIVKIMDYDGIVTELIGEVFPYNETLKEIYLSNLQTINGSYTFQNSRLTGATFPELTTINGAYTFTSCSYLQNLYIPKCIQLGETVGNDNIFDGIYGKTIILTIPASLMTCNGGQPDGDIQYLIDNNNVTIITV